MRQLSMGIRLRTHIPRWRRLVAVGAGVLLAGGLATGVAQWAGAAPQETVSQAQAKVNALQKKYDQANQRYDATTTKVTAAKSRLTQVTAEETADNKRYQTARKKFVQIASASYEDSGETSLAGLLTTSDPGTVLSEASILTELTSQRNAETTAFLDDARQLVSVRQQRQRTLDGITGLQKQQHAQLLSSNKNLQQQKSVLSGLTASQREQVAQNSVGGGTTTTSSSSSNSYSYNSAPPPPAMTVAPPPATAAAATAMATTAHHHWQQLQQ
jgi:outer membrane murein-binding lipoprotein Lpp